MDILGLFGPPLLLTMTSYGMGGQRYADHAHLIKEASCEARFSCTRSFAVLPSPVGMSMCARASGERQHASNTTMGSKQDAHSAKPAELILGIRVAGKVALKV